MSLIGSAVLLIHLLGRNYDARSIIYIWVVATFLLVSLELLGNWLIGQ